MTNLLPPNATRLERALAECCADIEQVPISGIKSLWNPNTCPVPLLPYLAWALSVDRWDDNWSERAKRQLLRDSAMIHRQKGTIAAIRRVVEPMGYLLEITEWWQENPPGPRGSFRLEIGVSENGISEATFNELERLIDDAKPVSRHLNNLAISLETHSETVFIAAISLGDILTIDALPEGEE